MKKAWFIAVGVILILYFGDLLMGYINENLVVGSIVPSWLFHVIVNLVPSLLLISLIWFFIKTMEDKKNIISKAKKSIYYGFPIFGGTLCWLYGFTANRFRKDEIFLLIIGGAIAGVALAMIISGIISLLKEKE